MDDIKSCSVPIKTLNNAHKNLESAYEYSKGSL